jgi:hypothetical protein
LSSHIPSGSPDGNHASIRAQEDFYRKWISKNLANETLAGPFASNPLCTEVSLVATGAVPKDSPGDFRIIHDLSFPAEDCLNASVPRHTYLEDYFVLALAKVDDVAQKVLCLHLAGHKAMLWGHDLKSCFRQVLECPSTWQFQCFFGPDGRFYIDLTALMGAVPSAMKAMRLGSVPLHAHIKEGHFTVLYIDDYTGVDKEEDAPASVASFDLKLASLNLRQTVEKQEDPCYVKTVLGIEVDCLTMTLRLSQGKLLHIKSLLSN